jgi:DNA modification methylase
LMPKYEGRLELTWTNKGMRLLAHEDGSYEWVSPSDYRVAEVRLLHDVCTVGETGKIRAADNLLIRGDALNALLSLARLPEFATEYLGKVKLAYLDPPFNTQQSFLQYDDALEHSVWLTMIRDRLVQVRDLLSPTGSVWVHCDDAEQHRLRSAMDEVFGPENFIATVIWEKADSARNDAKHLSTDQDYILVYAKHKESWTPNRLARTAQMNSIYSSPDGDPLPWFDGDPTAPGAKTHQGMVYAIQSPFTGQLQYPGVGRCWFAEQSRILAALSEWAPFELREIGDQKKRAQVCGVPEGEVRAGVPALMLGVPIDSATTSAQRRYNEGIWPEVIFRSGGTGGIGRKRYQPETGMAPRTLWLNSEVGHNRTAKAELKALFPGEVPFSTPKPERLLERILQIATEPGDIVLDCFVGSGTTAAVAQKMSRRWVVAERELDTVANFALPRLQKVVAGEDLGGITTVETLVGGDLPNGVKPGDTRAAAKTVDALSKAGALDEVDGLDEATTKALVKALRAADKTMTETTWLGGGGFRVLDVSPSMFEADGGLVFLADWMTNGTLAEATAAQLGFTYEPDSPFSGRKGRTRLAVVDGVVNESVVRLVVSALPDRERVVVCGTGIDTDARPILRELRPGSTLRKIPAALLDEYRSARQLRLGVPENDGLPESASDQPVSMEAKA